MHDFRFRGTVSRRQFLGQSALAGTALLARSLRGGVAAGDVLELGDRREPFVDDFLIDRLEGAELRMHRPEPREVAITCDAPWEGNTSAYYTIFQDGDLYRMYYRGSHFDEEKRRGAHPEFACYAESTDGIHWTKPELGLFEYQGSKANNIVWTGEGTHCFAPFVDGNPKAPADARYKAFGIGRTMLNGKPKSCLHAYHSPDGIHWSRTQPEAVLTNGAFDSQNIAFWDDLRGEYRAYWRYFGNGVRSIRTATSDDFLTWKDHTDLQYADAPLEHLYTNAIKPYYRAPHLYFGFPTRYQPKTQQVEPIFMSSRDGVHFRRTADELIPITAPKDRDGNRSNYMAYGMFPTKGNDAEISMFGTEAYYTGPGSRVRRFVFRADGFLSLHAPKDGTLVTKPLTFSGNGLSLNLRSGGPTRVEVQDVSGRPFDGFALADCTPLEADGIAQSVRWSGGPLGSLAGKPIRLHFALRNADLYSLKFGESRS